MENLEPAIGRIVLVTSVTDFSGERPAIITQVWNDQVINVNVFGDGSYDQFDTMKITSIMHHSISAKGSGVYWRWYTEEVAHAPV